ncbi:hypothetical protein V8E54_009521, partial [Elaphomyces granulatus]
MDYFKSINPAGSEVHTAELESKQTNRLYIRPHERKPHDPDVGFEEYVYYALHTREEQDSHPSEPSFVDGLIAKVFPRKMQASTGAGECPPILSSNETMIEDYGVACAVVSDEEWLNASRAFRTATSGACFFLIMTDILGPFGVGFALGTMGWGPGIALYTVFGLTAGYSGYLIWKCFMGLDSY